MLSMADNLNFVLNLVDRMSAPAKAASAALRTLEEQLKSVVALSKQLGSVKISVGGIKGSGTAGLKEKLGPMAGPGRKEAVASARYAEREAARASAIQAKAVQLAQKQAERAATAQRKAGEREALRLSKAAESLDKQRSSSLLRQFKERERAQVKGAMNAEREASKAAKASKSFSEGMNATNATHMAAVGAAISGVAIAATAATLAIGGLVVGGAALAIGASEAKNDTLDMLEAMLGSADAAHSALDAIRDITNETSASQKAVESAASSLVAAGVENQSLMLDAVKSIAQIDSVLEGKGGKIQAVFEKAAQSGKFDVKAKQLAGTGVQVQKLYAEIGRRTGVGVKQVEAQMKAGKISAEVGIAALSKVIDDRFGSLAQKQAMDIGPQFQRLKDNFGRLFEDVNTGPFLDAMSKMVSLFDSATPAGSAMKAVITAVFDNIFAAVARVAPYVMAFFKGLIIIGLHVAIAFKPLIKQLRLAFGSESKSGLETFSSAMIQVGKIVGIVASYFVSFIIRLKPLLPILLAIGAVLVAVQLVVWAAIGAFVYLATQAIGLVADALGWVIGIIPKLGDAISSAIAWVMNLGAAAWEAGGNLVSGLIDGVKNAAGRLYETVKNLALGALKKFKDFFGIASPSKLMAKMGVNLTQGLSVGIGKGAKSSSGAMVGAGARMSLGAATGVSDRLMGLRHIPANDNGRERLAQPTPAPRLAQPNQGRQGSGQSVVVQMAAGAVVIQGVSNAEDLREMFPEMMADWWERVGLSTGTGG